MSSVIWTIIVIAMVFGSWLIYEVWNAPLMPDDYGIEEEDLEE